MQAVRTEIHVAERAIEQMREDVQRRPESESIIDLTCLPAPHYRDVPAIDPKTRPSVGPGLIHRRCCCRHPKNPPTKPYSIARLAHAIKTTVIAPHGHMRKHRRSRLTTAYQAKLEDVPLIMDMLMEGDDDNGDNNGTPTRQWTPWEKRKHVPHLWWMAGRGGGAEPDRDARPDP